MAKEKLEELKEKVEKLQEELRELTDEELEQIFGGGGVNSSDFSKSPLNMT